MKALAEIVYMDYQVLFNVALGGFSFLAGFLIKNLWDEVKALQATDAKIINRVSAIETLVAGNYVTRAEFSNTMDRVFVKLDSISSVVSGKADRHQ
tara:strand:+ start:157 stop:444 length:288 start_codon:yes stop_codon:yes gene_type:complete